MAVVGVFSFELDADLQLQSYGDAQPYAQALRTLKSRNQSADGSGGDLREWKFTFVKELEGGGSSKIIAPDKTRTETVNYGPGPQTMVQIGPQGQWPVQIYPFGFRDARVGMPVSKKFYSTSIDGEGGELLRQEVFQYDQTGPTYNISCNLNGIQKNKTFTLNRTPRLARSTTFLFEGPGSALAQSTTFQYDLTNELTTGIDQTHTFVYPYQVVGNQTAKDADTPNELAQIPLGTLAKSSETQFHTSSTYRNLNILGLPTVAVIRDGNGTPVSRSEMIYDNCPMVCLSEVRALPTSSRTWDSTKGNHDNALAYLTTTATFDQWGNRTVATDAKGCATTTVYDSNHHIYPESVTSCVPSDGTHGSNSAFTSSTTYDYVTGLPLTATDINGQVTTMEYNDPLLRPTKVIAPNGHQTITEYGEGISETTRWVKVRSQIDANYWSEAKSFYDGLGRTYKTQKTDLSDSHGDIFTYTCFDIMGRVQKSSNPYRDIELEEDPCDTELQWTVPEYDDLSRTKKVNSPDATNVQITYALSTSAAPYGTKKTITDQAGKQRTGITDTFGNMVRVFEGPVTDNLYTDYVFDTLGNLRKTTQDTQVRYFNYDSLGRVLRAKQVEQDVNAALALPAVDPITSNNSWTVKYAYDDNSNIETTTDARNITIEAQYDRLNRLTKRLYGDSTPDVDFFYDGKGLPAAPADSLGKTTKVTSTTSETRNTSFDIMGRVLTSQQITDGQTYPFVYTYNLSGALIEETYPSGRVVKNTLNADGELAQVQSKKNSNSGFWTYADAFSYNATGAVTKMQLGNGLWETADYYPERMQVKQIGLGLTDSTQNLLKLEFKYNTPGQSDNNGSMREQKITVPTVGTNNGFTATQAYTYDNLNRLEIAEEKIGGSTSWKQKFIYDRYGNRTFDAANTTTFGSCPASVCNPTITGTKNQITQSGYDYDENGSLTVDGNGRVYSYDAEGHQKQVGDGEGLTIGEYFYDGEGRRVKKAVGSEVTIFVYDAGGMLTAEYSTTVASVEQAEVSYLTTDHLGSPRIITDRNAQVSSRKDFAAFGDETLTPQRTTGLGYTPPSVRQDYTGYQKDSESGLEFAQARYFNPQHGRFTSVDPLTVSAATRDPQTFNRYSYVLNSPYKFADPLGLMGQVCGAENNNCNGDPNTGKSYHTQDAENKFSVYIQTEVRTYNVIQTENDGRQATITITSIVTRSIDRDKNRQIGPDSDPEVTSTARNTGRAEFSQNDLNTMQDVTRDLVYVATKNKKDSALLLAMAQRETHFGVGAIGDPRNKGKPEMGAAINPLQLDGDANRKYHASSDDRLYNIEMSIRLLQENAAATRATSLADGLSVYNSGRFANKSAAGRQYANDIIRKRGAIRETVKYTERRLF